MNVSPQEAHDALNEIEKVIQNTRKSIAESCAAPILILWGVIWMIGYSGTQFFPRNAGGIWMPLCTIGGVGSWIIGMNQKVRSPSDFRIGIFWVVLFAYAMLWLFLLQPAGFQRGNATDNAMATERIGAFFATVPMFAYVVGGLWLGRFFIWLGLLVTVLTMVGLYALPGWFNLWMAFTGGGSLIASGIFIRRFWK